MLLCSHIHLLLLSSFYGEGFFPTDLGNSMTQTSHYDSKGYSFSPVKNVSIDINIHKLKKCNVSISHCCIKKEHFFRWSDPSTLSLITLAFRVLSEAACAHDQSQGSSCLYFTEPSSRILSLQSKLNTRPRGEPAGFMCRGFCGIRYRTREVTSWPCDLASMKTECT